MNASTAAHPETRGENLEWHAGAKSYLDRLGRQEYEQQRQSHLKGRRSPGTFIYWASDYYRALYNCLDQNDQELFSLLRGEYGAKSALGH